MFGEKSRYKPKSIDNGLQSSLITEDASMCNESPSSSREDAFKSSEHGYLELSDESPDPSFGPAAQQRLLESELTGKMYTKSAKYRPLEPFNESFDASWGEEAQKILIESELEV